MERGFEKPWVKLSGWCQCHQPPQHGAEEDKTRSRKWNSSESNVQNICGSNCLWSHKGCVTFMKGFPTTTKAFTAMPCPRPIKHGESENRISFQMPLHYPRYKKGDYETMPEWKLDCLLKEYGLPVTGDLNFKRNFAMGAFLWPSQNE
ncbi:hypothetical protein RJ641_035643 [Dillenia turbinata]|uniref:DUF7722 domain-containing protein n=1 Tax=Dillenia turbinata TaxID=194707 RepID=A0AAN8VWL1_9MAGN